MSFNGIDVCTNFADHLYNALVYAGIRTLRQDKDELQKGNKIEKELINAIQQSRISISIISKHYPSSELCLNELTEMSESRRTMDQTILPIFYKVEPRDVRNQIGIYAKVFEEHQIHFDEATVQKWKKALREVGELDGWHTKNNPYEGKLIKEVVKTVWSILNKRPSIVSMNLVGIQSHIKEMLMLLDIESGDRKIVGIHGLSGIGKTTIARAVYNTVFHRFEEHGFIENIQENAKKYGLPHLQNQLIFDILKQKNQNITSVDDEIKMIQERFCNKRVLIVLDDVGQYDQAKSLVGNHEWFGIGSKIIITSRKRDILVARKVDEIYEPNVMNLDDSLELFSHHAFGRDWPLEDYLDLSKAMVKTTRGLPLALQVVGSTLYLKGNLIWDDTLKKLQKVPNNDVMKRLQISYDELDDVEKQMFLDTSCFFIGMNKDIACHIWDGCGFAPQPRLDSLCVRSLVTISEKGELRMHDLLRDLGREIVRQENKNEPGERTRIWSQEDVLDVMDAQTGTSNVEGLIINFILRGQSLSPRKKKRQSQCLMSEGFAAMKNLRLLQVDYASFSGNFTHYFSELRWLSWKGCSDQYAQTKFCPRKLAVLDLSNSEITEKWMGWNFIKMAVNLKVLDLKCCSQLPRTPDFSANQHLEVLTLHSCINLVEIDTSIGYLRNLLTLDMSGCKNLVELPFEICQLTSLKTLDLSFCTALKSLLNLPQHLEVLILKDCEDLVKIDTSIGYLKNLVTLDMHGCKSLVDLPIEVCQLTSLERLDLSSCDCLKMLPEKLGSMISLTTLDLNCCWKLMDLPSEISQLISLKVLDLWQCYGLHKLPEKLGDLISLTKLRVEGDKTVVDLSMLSSLKNLKELSLQGFDELLHISNLPLTLTHLEVSFCSSIQYISGLPSSLTSLNVKACDSLGKLSTSGLRNLERFYLYECDELEEIEGVGDHEGLNYLVFFMMDNAHLKELPNLSNLKKLRYIEITNCQELSKIESLEGCESLEKLTVSMAPSLKTLPDVSTLKNLRDLFINGCDSMERLPDLSYLNKLQVLWIDDLMESTTIPGLDRLESLQKLTLIQCDIERLPDLSNFKKLTGLQIEDCENITEICALGRLEFLEKLDISGCESLERLPDLSNMKNLTELRIINSMKLTEIHGLDRLEFLVELHISGCESLERLHDLSNLKKLKVLQAYDCEKLTEIQAVNGLKSLERLIVKGCISLENLPDLTNFEKFWWENRDRTGIADAYYRR